MRVDHSAQPPITLEVRLTDARLRRLPLSELRAKVREMVLQTYPEMEKCRLVLWLQDETERTVIDCTRAPGDGAAG